MVTKTIPDAPAASSVGGTDLLWVWQSSTLKKATVSQLPGTSAPAIINGSVDITAASPNGSWATVVTGNGQSLAQRQVNAASMQAAINYSLDNRKFIVVPPGDYEIDNTTGLVVGARGQGRARWMGHTSSTIWQCHTNAPILTVGDITGNNGDEDHVVDGFSLQYGVDQTGQTAACALVLGYMWRGEVSNGRVDGTHSGNYPFRCANIPASGLDWFSNTVRNMVFRGCQNTNFNIGSGTTGSVFQNIYCSNPIAGPAAGSVSYAAFSIDKGNGSFADGVIDQLNCEWTKADRIVRLNNIKGLTIHGLHIEGCELTGNGGGIIEVVSGNITITGLMIGNVLANTGRGYLGGSGAVVYSYGGDVMVNNMRVTADVSGEYNVPMYLFQDATSFDPDTHLNAQFNNVRVDDPAPFFYPDTNLSGSNYGPIQSLGRYMYADGFSYAERVVQIIPDADFTHFGGYDRSILLVQPTLTGNRTLTLSSNMRPSGVGSTSPRSPGDIITVRRAAYYSTQGTVSANTVTIKNLTSGGTTLATMASATAVTYVFRFDGTNWALVS